MLEGSEHCNIWFRVGILIRTSTSSATGMKGQKRRGGLGAQVEDTPRQFSP